MQAFGCAPPDKLIVPLQITVASDRVLTISGERKSDLCIGWDERVHERHFGHFDRKVTLADNADDSTVSASLELGVLKITIKKIPETERKKAEWTINIE